MHIKKIHVKNFRAIRDCALSLGRLTALVGPNGAGKSAFLHALALFQGRLVPTVEDYYNRDTGSDIEVKVVFAGLPGEAAALFSKYVRDGELEVVRIAHWDDGKVSSTLHGYSRRNPDFAGVLGAPNATVAKYQYNDVLLKSPNYEDLPRWTSLQNARATLHEWEEKHPDKCALRPDDGRFFGYDGVGEGYLGRYMRILHVQAVRDAADDGTDGRGSALGELLSLTVKKALAEKGDFRGLEARIREMFDKAMGGGSLPELDALKADLNRTLGSLARGAQVDLDWTVPEPSIGMPRASARLVEDRYSSPVGGAGHGLQRAFIMAVLHNLSKAEAGAAAQEGGSPGDLPSFVLAIDEPELYQHPTRMRHLARRLRALSDGGIPGVAGQMQVLYTTHSPHFVFADRIGQVRVVSKRGPAAGDGPGATAVSGTTPAGILQYLRERGAAPRSDRAVDHLLLRAMGPAASEGFFADIVVLVEGASDRVMLEAAAEAGGCQLDALGAAVVPCGSKSAMPFYISMFRSLGMHVYAVWDADENSDDQREESERIASALDYKDGDWRGKTTGLFSCLQTDLEATVRSDLREALGPASGEEPDREIVRRLRRRHGVRKKDSKTIDAQLLAEEIREKSLHLPTLESIARAIAGASGGRAPAAPRHPLYKCGKIPSPNKMIYPLLELCSDGKVKTTDGLEDELSGWLGLSAEMRRTPTRGGRRIKIESNMSWALSYLYEAGLLDMDKRINVDKYKDRRERSHYTITEEGGRVVADPSTTNLTLTYLRKKYPARQKQKGGGGQDA